MDDIWADSLRWGGVWREADMGVFEEDGLQATLGRREEGAVDVGHTHAQLFDGISRVVGEGRCLHRVGQANEERRDGISGRELHASADSLLASRANYLT